VKYSEFTKNRNGAVNVNNQHQKCRILLNYCLLHISKVAWKLFRIFEEKNMVFKHIFTRILIHMLKNITKWCLAGRYTWKPQLPYSSFYRNSILSLWLQNTLTKTSVQHFPITYEAVTDTFMLGTIDRNITPLFSWPHTSTNSRYNTICKCRDGVVIRVTQKHGLLDVFVNSLTHLSKWLLNALFRAQIIFLRRKKWETRFRFIIVSIFQNHLHGKVSEKCHLSLVLFINTTKVPI